MIISIQPQSESNEKPNLWIFPNLLHSKLSVPLDYNWWVQYSFPTILCLLRPKMTSLMDWWVEIYSLMVCLLQVWIESCKDSSVFEECLKVLILTSFLQCVWRCTKVFEAAPHNEIVFTFGMIEPSKYQHCIHSERWCHGLIETR